MFSHRASATTPLATHPARAPRLLIVGLIFFAFALRLYKLGGESLWYDETVSVFLATSSLTDLLAHTARDIHPPAYYLMLYLWRLLAQPTVAFGLEFLYAWPSFALDMLVIVLTYAVTKRAFGTRAAIWAIAFAALHPVQIWFAQEVRMYALGACSLLLTLWAVTPLLTAPPAGRQNTIPRQTAILYPIAALLGLYTLYYFVFWLAILNLAMLIRLHRHAHALRAWILLQLLIVIGWLPWLPIFIRQALNPPVPPWRVPWQTPLAIAQSFGEALAAIWVGHTPPLALNWPWAILIIATGTAFFVYAKSTSMGDRLLWLLLVFGAPLLLFAVSLVGPPIYHVRYVATYAPLFAILLGALLANLRVTYASAIFALFALTSGLALHQLWTNPRFAADDHRAAVNTLAQQWRPGDTILVNAGWVYTALRVYWPTELPTPDAARPPAIADTIRLGDPAANNVTTAPLLVRTGSINGDPDLGWGLPESDFFAISDSATTDALRDLTATHTRLWHYRLYDTVSDPSGVIRQWLTANTTQEFSQPIPGRDYLLLEAYRTNALITLPLTTTASTRFPGASLVLRHFAHATTITAGETLYVDLIWQTETAPPPATAPALSLRLYDGQGQLVQQNDTPINPTPTGNRQMGALPIPANSPAGTFTVAIVVYDPATIEPYPAFANNGELPTPIPLGQVTITPPN